MPKCVICNKKLSKGPFSKNKQFALMNHDYICRRCAFRIGITNKYDSATYTATKVRKEFFDLYPEELGLYSYGIESENTFTNATVDLKKKYKDKVNKNEEWKPRPRKRRGCLGSVLIWLSCLIFIIGFGNAWRNESDINENSDTTPDSTNETSAVSQTVPVSRNEISNIKENDRTSPVKYTDLDVGTVVEVGDLEIGLSYVKRSGTHTDAMGINVDVAVGNEVIYAFFEVHNKGDELLDISKSSVSAYADSTKIEAVPDYMLFKEDNIKEYQSYEVDGGKYAIVPFNFEVKKGWESLTVFYDDCSWTIDANDVTREPYKFASLFEHKDDFIPTSIGDVTELSKYTLQFDGIEIIPQEYSWSGPWIAFKFTLNNTDSESLDLSLVGHKMRGYCNGYLTDDASYTVDNNLNGYINIFEVDEVKPGMNARVYVAFEIQETQGKFSMAFDDGYIFHNTAWMINAEN